MAKELKRGWIPHDEGTLAQSAERVLDGQLPHKDFNEVYTGGLTYLNALAFRVLGVNLASMRYVLYLFFLAWIPALYYVALRFVSAFLAGSVTLLAVVWSVPNYAAPMPSWYNLFFATFGLMAILRYTESEERRWLFLAGLCGGISFLFKISGLYFVVGVLLFLAFREQGEPSATEGYWEETFWYRVFLGTSVLFYLLVVFSLIRRPFNFIGFLYFWVPHFALGSTVIWHEVHRTSNRKKKLVFLFRDMVFFGAGVALPVLVFLLPNLVTGSLVQFVKDVFVLPRRRFVYAAMTPPVRTSLFGLGADLLFIGLAFMNGRKTKKVVIGLTLATFPLVLFMAALVRGIHMTVWATAWVLEPLVVTLGTVFLMRGLARNEINKVQGQRIFLLLSVTTACSLVQFPFTAPIYFCYVAPLVVLSLVAVISDLKRLPRLALVGAFCFYFVFIVFEVTPGFVSAMGQGYEPNRQSTTLALPRAGALRVSTESATTYDELGILLAKHASGKYIYATPDCPEVYFLYGFRNPTKTLYDFFDDPLDRAVRIIEAIHEHNVRLVVINRNPKFSGDVPADLLTVLEHEFPRRADVGKFEVRWKP